MLDITPYRQTRDGYCGPASLKMLLRFHGVDQHEEYLAGLSGCSNEDGVDVGGLARAVEQFGFQAIIRQMASLDDLKYWVVARRTPVIVDWWSGTCGHYSVVVDVTDEEISLADPEMGAIRSWSWERWHPLWFDFRYYPPGDPSDLVLRSMLVVV